MEIPDEDLDPYLGDGPSGEYFHEETAILKLLLDDQLFVNGRKFQDLDGKAREETIVMFVLCNDLFYWGCADAESLPYSEIRKIYEMHIADPTWGTQKWCCLRRNLRPQTPIVKMMRDGGHWDDAMEALPTPEPS
jgi:hypothetical protein